VKEKKWGSCNITPLVALKSPTSVIHIVVEIVVVVETFILDVVVGSHSTVRPFPSSTGFLQDIVDCMQLVLMMSETKRAQCQQ